MGKLEIRREAIERQGTIVKSHGRVFKIVGDQRGANFDSGSEGLVHFAVDQRTNTDYRIKCFWEPGDDRYRRSEVLVQRQLANAAKPSADALGGAPFELIGRLGPETPFAVVMKSVRGFSWARLRERAEGDTTYPPKDWPPVQVRATWAYGLATAVKRMEGRQFVHADLSPGNVVVTPEGTTAGDMALVDFDGFIDLLNGELHPPVRGSSGYASAEMWNDRSGGIGSDRVGMAILIQEFLAVGDATITKNEAFGWVYDQDNEISTRSAEPHPLIAKKYPEIAELVVDTLRASDPARRADPDDWRKLLIALVDGKPLTPPLRDVILEPHPLKDSAARLAFGPNDHTLDLSQTLFGIRATLERLPAGSVRLVVHPGAELRVRKSSNAHWTTYAGSQAVNILPGLVLFDNKGKLTAKVDATS
jgi:hypothetical protein